MNLVLARQIWSSYDGRSITTGRRTYFGLRIGHPHPLVWYIIINLTMVHFDHPASKHPVGNDLLWLMKQKIYNNIDAVHYYEWTHCCCSSIFFRSILENRMLFWTDIIRFRSPQVLLHYEYHWQLVQVFCHHKFIYVYYYCSDRYVSTFVSDHPPSFQVLRQLTSYHRILLTPLVLGGVLYSIILFIFGFPFACTTNTLMGKR